MNELANFWDLIVKSNTFNFAILLLIFAMIFKKINISAIIEKMKNDILSAIENANLTKEKAKSDLGSAKKAVKNLDVEVKERLEKAEGQAKTVAKQILEDAAHKVIQIEGGISRAVEAEEKTLSSSLSKKAVKASVELAKDNIKKTLNANPELHKKFINESIDDLEGINF